MSNIIKFRILLWLGLMGATLWLLYMGIVPSGHITYIHDFDDNDYFVHKLSPVDRLGETSADSRRIIGDPVYYTLRTPRTFDTARVTYRYENTGELPVIETGVLVDKTIWRYDLKPLENRIIDQLSLVWDKIEENSTVLLQRQRKYQSITDFLENLPMQNEIALYKYNLKSDYIIPDYASTEGGVEIAESIRGPFQFYTYIKDEVLDMKFTFLDLNENKDADPLDVHLYYNDQLIDVRHLDDDGVASDTREAGEARTLDFTIPNLPEGAYKLEVRCNDDIVTSELKSAQEKISFLNKIRLADGGKENFSLFTDGSEVHAQTVNPDRVQTLNVGGEAMNISETYRQYSRRTTGTSTEIKIPKDDIIISGNGVFAFTREALVNPRFREVGPSLDINGSNVNYVLANYDFPKTDGDWQTASAEFDLSGAYRENQGYSFIISIPGLRADDDVDDYIELGEIRVELAGRSLREKLKEMFKN